MSLATPLRRSVFALPLLAVALAGFASVERPVPPTLQAWQPVFEDCGSAPRPAGVRGLARMPGDLGTVGRRFRCAG